MAVLTSTSREVSNIGTATVNTASASDTLTYAVNTGQFIVFHNSTGGSLTAVVKGSAPSATYPVSGAGTTTDLSAGLSVVVAAGATKFLNLDKIPAYLAGSGTVTISGAATLSITVYA